MTVYDQGLQEYFAPPTPIACTGGGYPETKKKKPRSRTYARELCSFGGIWVMSNATPFFLLRDGGLCLRRVSTTERRQTRAPGADMVLVARAAKELSQWHRVMFREYSSGPKDSLELSCA